MAYDNDDIAFLDYFTALAPLDEEERENQRKREIIEAMRGESTRPLRMRRAGPRVQVAPSPFEGLAQLGQAYMARKGGQKAYAEDERLAGERSTAMGGLRAALLGNRSRLDEEEELYNPYFRGSSRSV